jgi:hypothetical protein
MCCDAMAGCDAAWRMAPLACAVQQWAGKLRCCAASRLLTGFKSDFYDRCAHLSWSRPISRLRRSLQISDAVRWCVETPSG